MSFADHFGGQADAYASNRPTYPVGLFDALVALAPGRSLAWDVGTGSGQAAVELGERFARVVATDGSANQLERATPHPNVEYAVGLAESPPAGVQDADMVAVAQALHWFDLDAFATAVRAALRPGGVVAAWSYGLFELDEDIDGVLRALHDDVLGAHWPAGRRHVIDGYRELWLPGEPLDVPPFEMRVRWTLPQMVGYVESWSATRRARADGNDPVGGPLAELAEAWGDPARERDVRWPLTVLAHRIA